MKATEYAAMFDAESEHWWYHNVRGEVKYWIKQASATNAALGKKKLLDLGCGTGGMLKYLRERFKNIDAFGLDYYALALDFAKRRNIPRLLQGDVKKMPFAEQTFDFIICLDVLYTKEAYPGFQNTLNDVRRLLKNDGMFILQLPAFQFLQSQHDLNVHGVHRFTANEIQASLRQAGFSRYKIYYRYNLLFGVAWVVRKIIMRDQSNSHVATPAPWLNSLLYSYFTFESWLNKKLPVPFGLSVFAVAYR